MATHFPYQRILMVGIGGIGMSALAQLLRQLGKEVVGVNDIPSPETLDPLRNDGMPVYLYPETPEARDFDAIVYSAAWKGRAPEYLARLKESGLPFFSYGEALGKVSRNFQTVAIAGTHGKTTTTGLFAYGAIFAGLNPTVLVGSKITWPDGKTSNFRSGGNLFVVEACEYERHFLYFHPDLALITNIEHDHPDTYPTFAEFQAAFQDFARQAKKTITTEEALAAGFLDHVPQLQIPGVHNRKNASLALAGLAALGADVEQAAEGLAAYPGSWRRFEYKGRTARGARVFDDYAHHPTEIRATLQAARTLEPTPHRIVAVFEPHTFSRTKALWDAFTQAFAGADEVIIAPIYPAREAPIAGVSAETLAAAIAKHQSAQAAKTRQEALEKAAALAGPEDVVLVMNAGDLHEHIPHILASS